ncbi:MAG: hypothetical protein Q8K67_04660, partial [Geothrix sp.]|nr:hypothetical protein [Geothrix sp.]
MKEEFVNLSIFLQDKLNITGKWAGPKLWATFLALLMSATGTARPASKAVPAPTTWSTVRLAALAATASPLRPGALASSSLHLVGLRLATVQDPTTYPVQKLGQSAILHPENPGTYTVLMGTMEVEGVTYIPHLEQR